MTEGPSNFGGQNENTNLDSEQKKLRINSIRHELMEIERQVMKLKIHPTETSVQKIEDLHTKQVELLAELQNLESKK